MTDRLKLVVALCFKADTDFAGAMQDGRAIGDKSKRYEFLMRIAQYLGNR